ncbi:MAG: LPS assembly lipoprotein LptE [Bacteroidales bacterium]|jgi:hypothetical protein|nr:LPS assembly lipoprotein LptE [Bacteroidales bacterium]
MRKILYIPIIILLLTGCTVGYTFTGASISADAKTVSIDYFVNRTAFAPSFGDDFTDALRNKFSSQTRLDLISDNGDLRFSGEIKGYAITAEAVQGNDIAAQNRLTITVRVKYTNVLTPGEDFDKDFSQYSTYPSSELEPPVSIVSEVMEKLIEDVFNASVANW